MAGRIDTPVWEQLDLTEDVDRLCEIGDLIRYGFADIEDFNLGTYETVFMEGYVNVSKDGDPYGR